METPSIDRRGFLLGSGLVATAAAVPALSSTAGVGEQSRGAVGVSGGATTVKATEGRHAWNELYINALRANLV